MMANKAVAVVTGGASPEQFTTKPTAINKSASAVTVAVLPTEVLIDCWTFLTLSHVAAITTVCKQWHTVAADPLFWRNLSFVNPISARMNSGGSGGSGGCATPTASASLIRTPSANKPDQKSGGTAPPASKRLKLTDQNTLVPANDKWKELYRELDDLVTNDQTYDLLERGVYASSADHPEQGINQLLNSSQSFWSSKGSADMNSNEVLVFAFCQPICVVTEIQVHVYACHYQQKIPIYGPQQIRFFIGYHEDSTLKRYHYLSPTYDCENHPRMQTYRIAPALVSGGYLGIELIGRRTKQPQDDLYYTVLRYIRVLGLPFGALKSRPVLSHACAAFAMQQNPTLFRSLLPRPATSAGDTKQSTASGKHSRDEKSSNDAANTKKPKSDSAAAGTRTGSDQFWSSIAANASGGGGATDTKSPPSQQQQPQAATVAKANALSLDDDELIPTSTASAAASSLDTLSTTTTAIDEKEVKSLVSFLQHSASSLLESSEKTRNLLAKIRSVLIAGMKSAGAGGGGGGSGGATLKDIARSAPRLMITIADMVLGNVLTNQNARSEVVSWIEEMAYGLASAEGGSSGGSGGSSGGDDIKTKSAAHKLVATTFLGPYIVALISSDVRLNHAESMAVARIEIYAPSSGVLAIALARRQLLCAVEVGDALYDAAMKDRALAVYALGSVPDKTIQLLVETGQPQRAIRYCVDVRHNYDWINLLTRLIADSARPFGGLLYACRVGLILITPDSAPPNADGAAILKLLGVQPAADDADGVRTLTAFIATRAGDAVMDDID